MKQYPGKLLLFGEYVLLLGAPALAMPAPAFFGQWAWRNPQDAADAHHDRLLAFAKSPVLAGIAGLDATAFSADVENGQYFPCNIPAGYGLGSSGALCAAVYDRYAREKTTDPAELRGIFSSMENFFHGRSSGLDPLTSYIDQPLLLEKDNQINALAPPIWPEGKPVVFLVNSEQPRQTGPLVAWFMVQCEDAKFIEKLQQEWLPAHDAVLQAWLHADADAFWPALRWLSFFQSEHLPPMIPDAMREAWKQALESEDVALKLCGAGGGGFFLGFAKDQPAALSFAKKIGLPIVFPL